MNESDHPPTVHPSAVVLPGATLGPGVEVGPFCVVEPGATLAAGVVLKAHVHLQGKIFIGEGTHIGSGSVLGGAPQDRAYQGERSTVRIGNHCQIFEHVTVHRATGDAETLIGNEVMMMAGSHVGHNVVVEDGATLVNGAAVAGHSHIGAKAILASYVGIHQFSKVGRLSLIAASSVVTQDVPPYSIATGSYPIRWRAPNAVGMKRAGMPAEERDAVRKSLKYIFSAPESVVARAQEYSEHPQPAVREIATFVRNSKRGICAAPSA